MPKPTRKGILQNWTKESKIRHSLYFAGTWASFNAWYRAAYPKDGDRNAINKIKARRKNDPMVKAFWRVARKHHNPAYPRISKAIDYEPHRGWNQYSQDNVVTRFVRFVLNNPTVNIDKRKRITKKGIFNYVGVATYFIDDSIFLELYRKVAQAAVRHMYIETIHRVQKYLEEFGIFSLGCCFYVSPLSTSQTLTPIAKYIEPEVNRLLDDILRARALQPLGLFADVIEMLYQVRNSFVHGDLDPSDAHNNDLLQAAYECLLAIIQEYVGETPSSLHP